MECGVRLEAKLQLLFVWMWKCNTAALAHTETRRSFLEEKRPFAVEKYTTTTFHCYSHRERRTEKSVAYRGDMEFLLHTTREYNGKGHPERRPFGRLFR